MGPEREDAALLARLTVGLVWPVGTVLCDNDGGCDFPAIVVGSGGWGNWRHGMPDADEDGFCAVLFNHGGREPVEILNATSARYSATEAARIGDAGPGGVVLDTREPATLGAMEGLLARCLGERDGRLVRALGDWGWSPVGAPRVIDGHFHRTAVGALIDGFQRLRRRQGVAP